jgi:F-type H+-transporting ATPase subunit gamma
MPSTRDIKRRIRSIGNTKKITRAMEMVAAAKMRRAVEAVLKTRRYANLSWATVLNLSQAAGFELHPLLQKRAVAKKIAVILITSNRGLCGGFNSAMVKKVQESIIKHPGGDGKPIQTEFFLLGKKGAAVYKYYKYNIIADFPKEDLIDDLAEAIPVAKLVIKDYLEGKYDKIFIAYTDFISAIKQIPKVRQLLPFDIKENKEFLEMFKDQASERATESGTIEYLFEPSPAEVLDEMLPRLIEVQLYQAMLESNASEHSARMSAMRQATDAAGELVDELTLFYNKARQASITREIAEISAGANALK